MRIDYGRVLVDLDDIAEMVNKGAAGLPAVTRVLETAEQVTGAAGATFVEFGPDGGRVLAATGAMLCTQGLPVLAECAVTTADRHRWLGPVDQFSAEISAPLRASGFVNMAGCVAHADERVSGEVHVFFDPFSEFGAEDLPVLAVLAHAAGQIYADSLPKRAGTADGAGDFDLFLAVTGHELRTPVTVIKGFASTLADRWEALEERNRYQAVRAIAQRADELALLVDRLLAASGGTPMAQRLSRLVPFDLVESVSQAAAGLPAELRRAVCLDMPDRLPPAYGVPASLSSILTELVRNAVRYGSHHSAAETTIEDLLLDQLPEADVEVRAGADEQTVFFQVCDRGPGIDPAHVELAFTRFWQGSQGGRSKGGMGLGLSLVRRVVEQQHGWVSLRTRNDGGTVAEVRLPRADGPRRSGLR